VILRALILLLALAAPAAAQTDQEAIEQGRYLAIAGDCTACHTNPAGGKPFAGGYGIFSPLGTIYSTNITPSNTAGIGNYTEADFARVLRRGVRPDGRHLYPAMPYTAYAHMTDADIHVLYTYFMQDVAPVDTTGPQTALPFPFNIRASMIGWNLLFLDTTPFQPQPSQSAPWNRGAYLANAVAHCTACHTPRNTLMAEVSNKAYGGTQLGSWFAPNITSDPMSGIGGWSQQELVQYFKTGAVHGKAQAAGGMAEAVTNSLQFLTEPDLNAIAAYLKTVPAIRDPSETQPAYDHGTPAAFEPMLRGAEKQNSATPVQGGAALFSGNCASCHQPSGSGTPDSFYPSLLHNTATGRPNASNLVSAILFGVERTIGKTHVVMPRFDSESAVQPLSDAEVADISNYVLQQFGNPVVRVTAADVATLRAGAPSSPLEFLTTDTAKAMLSVAVLLVVLGLIAAVVLFRHRKHA
jgi:mono/diheme cytochrome c family protein